MLLESNRFSPCLRFLPTGRYWIFVNRSVLDFCQQVGIGLLPTGRYWNFMIFFPIPTYWHIFLIYSSFTWGNTDSVFSIGNHLSYITMLNTHSRSWQDSFGYYLPVSFSRLIALLSNRTQPRKPVPLLPLLI